MLNDIIACFGIALITVGIAFIYWPLSFVFVGSVIVVSCIMIARSEGNKIDDSKDNV